jgi:RNA polymerase sigma-70 factor (ECF subfamily)
MREKRSRLKRGSGRVSVTLEDELAVTDGADVALLDLETGLQQLARVADRPARVVECRFFGGLSIDETALALGITTRTVNRAWAFAPAWLYDYLRGSGPA